MSKEYPDINAKTATPTLRIDPAIKEGLRLAAEKEHRSLANMDAVVAHSIADQHTVGAS